MNETIKTQLNHRSIRQFTGETISDDIINTLVDVARHTSTSNFMQSYSIVCLTSQEKKEGLAQICKQYYVAEASHVFVFVVDHYRNQQIANEKGQESTVLEETDRWMIGMTDAVLAAQNMMVATESLGLGGVFLGSILNDNQATMKLLNLPEKTFAVLGLAIGYPNQEPQIKPRLPKEMMLFENEYQCLEPYLPKLKEYDERVTTYYDLRDANNRVDSFTKQITDGMNRKPETRLRIKSDIQGQGLMKH